MPDEPAIHVLVGSPDPLALTNLATGGIIGAAGAVVAAIILGAFEALRRRMRRREQIAFIRQMTVAQFTKIRDEKPLPPLPDGSPAPSIHQVHWMHYQHFLRDFEVALSYRLTMLDYGKTHALRSVLARQRGFNQNLFDPPRRLPPSKYYRDYYDEFQKIGWLGLPCDLFPPSWSGPQESS